MVCLPVTNIFNEELELLSCTDSKSINAHLALNKRCLDLRLSTDCHTFHPMSTIHDVARLAGVSVSTVSLAFNSPERVSQEKRGRISRAAVTLEYKRADPIAQTLSSGRSKLIGMLPCDISNPFTARLFRVFERYIRSKDYLVIVMDTSYQPEREAKALQYLSSMRVAGIIIDPSPSNSTETSCLSNLQIPFILFDQKPSGIQGDYVGSNNQLASAMLTKHLIQLGHRRIGLLGGTTGNYTATERLTGFIKTLQTAGLEVHDELIVDARYRFEDSYAQTKRLLTLANPPTALLACNNDMALAALQAMRDLGIECPGDVSLTGIDDMPWMHMLSPRITMAVQPVDAMALALGKLIMERIEQHQSLQEAEPKFTNHIFTPIFAMGESCRAVHIK